MHKVGTRSLRLEDAARRDWDDRGPRPLSLSVWYPASDDSVERELLAPEDEPLFRLGRMAVDAPLRDAPKQLPMVLLSHGTGGAAGSLSWLGAGLAAEGYVVIGVNHHGNTALEPHHAAGFLCWWERARDLTVALDQLAADGPFAGRLDLGRVYAAGFSLGGYTVLALAGAISDLALFRAWGAGNPLARGPAEFPDVIDRIPKLLAENAVFRASWEGHGASFADARVRAVISCAPAPTVRAFTAESLAAIPQPITLVATRGDREAPYDQCALWLSERLATSELTLLGPELGHYAFLSEGTELGRARMPEILVDAPGVQRRRLHERVVALARATFADDRT